MHNTNCNCGKCIRDCQKKKARSSIDLYAIVNIVLVDPSPLIVCGEGLSGHAGPIGPCGDSIGEDKKE